MTLDWDNQNGAQTISLKQGRHTEALAWLSEVPYLEIHARIRARIIPGTSAWLSSKFEFLTWEAGSSSGVFCLCGPTGSGQTTICSMFINEIQRLGGGNPTICLNYFYCSSICEQQHSAKSILLAFIHQILSTLPLGPNIIEYHYDAWNLKGFGSEDISLEEVGNLYEAAVTQFHRIYIVLDGISDLDSNTVSELLDALRAILEASGVCFKIFISFKGPPMIKRPRLQNWEWTIQQADTADDLRKLFDVNMDRIEGDTSLEVRFQAELKRCLYNKLFNNSQATFLWIELLFDGLMRAERKTKHSVSLKKYPTRLREIYNMVWKRINAQPERGRFIALTMVEFLTYSREPILLN